MRDSCSRSAGADPSDFRRTSLEELEPAARGREGSRLHRHPGGRSLGRSGRGLAAAGGGQPGVENQNGGSLRRNENHWRTTFRTTPKHRRHGTRALLILDATLCVFGPRTCAFYQSFHVSADETDNRLTHELGNGEWEIPALRTLLEDIVPTSSVFNDFELEHTFPVIGRRVMLLNAANFRRANTGSRPSWPWRRRPKRNRRRNDNAGSAYARSLIEASPDPLVTISPE